MGLTITQAIARVASRLNKSSTDTTVIARLKNHINDECQEKWTSYPWSFRYREYAITLSPRVTSGTMTATNGSPTVTASGTPFNSSVHSGAWIRFTADARETWYRSRTVNSTSSVTIEPSYQGITGSLKAYELVKTDYLLPSELVDTEKLSVTHGHYNFTPEYISRIDHTNDFPPSTTGTPIRAAILRQEQSKSTYSTGTVVGTVGSNTLTGTGTAWLANVKEGDSIVVGSDTSTYTVYKIHSDTLIELYQNLTLAASGASYTASRQFGKIIRIWPGADDSYVVFIRGLRAYPDLISNSDTNELLQRYPSAVIEGAVWREASSSPDPREDNLFQRAEFKWDRAKSEDEQIFPKTNRNPIYNPRVRRVI